MYLATAVAVGAWVYVSRKYLREGLSKDHMPLLTFGAILLRPPLKVVGNLKTRHIFSIFLKRDFHFFTGEEK